MLRWLLWIFVVVLLIGGSITGWVLYHKGQEPVRDVRFDKHIAIATREYPVDPLLVRAMIWKESDFDPDAYGLAKERGLMQVTPIAAEDWIQSEKIDPFELDDLYDPFTNIRAGSFFISRALDRWSHTDYPLPFALAEYNAGRRNALRWVDPDNPTSAAAFRERITFPTTAKYINDIEAKYTEYKSNTIKTRWQKWWKDFRQRVRGEEAADRSLN